MRYILLLVAIAIMYTSNPSLSEHQQAVKDEVSVVIKNYFPSNSETTADNLISSLGGLFVDGLVGGAVESYVTRKDYFIFSLTNVNFNGQSRVVGLGVLGNVIIRKEFANVIKQLLPKKTKEVIVN